MRRFFLSSAIIWMFMILIGQTINGQGPQQSPEMTAAMGLVKEQKWTEAEKALGEVVRKEPKNGRAWFNLGMARHSQEKWESAIEAFKKTVEIAQVPAAMYNVAAGYARLGRKDEAFEWLEKALNSGAAFGTNISADPDFETIRADARFKQMLEIVDRKKNPCQYSAESRQFDFWVGDWDVLVGGKKVGENLVRMELKGCTLVENWNNLNGGYGKSLNSYNSSTKKWKQFYVDSSGSMLEFEGGFKDGVMHLEGETIDGKGAKTLHILEFHDLPDKTVRQWWQQSTDDGKTWTTVWDSIYVKKK
ncbi:MAG: tetratricopeptide repeat protein [Pyrinomonadaceae bacterium]